MPSGHLNEVFASSTFRRAAAGIVLVWALTAAAAFEALQPARILLLPAGFLLALVVAYLIARRTVLFLAGLERASSRLSNGEFQTRIRRPGDKGDFDRAVALTNAMLDQLEQSMKTLAQVTDNIAHDLRTPLTRLQGQLDLLKRHPDPDDTLINAVQDEANQILSTFNALLRIAQIESGSRRRSFRSFDMARVADDVAELYAPVLGDKGIAFELSIPPSDIRIYGDRDLWMQALSNLLDNAYKYTPQGGRVALEVRTDGVGTFYLAVRDSGPGIPEPEMERVFQRFYRLSHHRGEPGNGIGLTLVKAICDLHGAKIELRNEGGLVVGIRLGTPAEST